LFETTEQTSELSLYEHRSIGAEIVTYVQHEVDARKSDKSQLYSFQQTPIRIIVRISLPTTDAHLYLNNDDLL